MRSRCRRSHMSGHRSRWLIWLVALSLLLAGVQGMTERMIRELKKETEHMFYHGFENYMKHAFPEDELRPLSCKPLTRDRENPAHIALNDVLGNYSLTLIDSLSTLAILSAPDSEDSGQRKAWGYFQDGVKELVQLYGDGSDGPAGQGSRLRGFDSDSKVQVFETVIRGLGGLLSAHLFAVGDLPIRGYHPLESEALYAKTWDKHSFEGSNAGIRWPNGFRYDGQLLRLAHDLGKRILPAFYTKTGLPYPRVNLKHGVPFYANSPLNMKREKKLPSDGREPAEITETCSAGAGSLVLEFTVLSRLTGDSRFEESAKRAFWAVWERRTNIGLIGGGIDAETGQWVNSYTGIGAGIDSFFEYALKSYILLSAGDRLPPTGNSNDFAKLAHYFPPLTDEQHSAVAFLQTWQDAKTSIKRHLYRGPSYQHPHYIQGDIFTGATRAFWIDSLSAYYPGLLTLGGDVDEAIEAHLLTTAVWTRFSALPERWNVATGGVEGGLGWWGGRPEFIESNYYLFRATEDPWYLHVGEMVLRDIKRRCWTKCGWAGLQDVRNGELSDRMESFFLGETAKYLFLLFDADHPLNRLDAPFVFSTEGHPLLVPKDSWRPSSAKRGKVAGERATRAPETCPLPPIPQPFGISSTAARPDVFHAASLARLHMMPARDDVESAIVEYASDHPSISLSDLISPSNYTFFPWTLPMELVPHNAMSSPMAIRPTLDISFPHSSGTIIGPGSLERVNDGILIRSIGGLRLGMIQDVPLEANGISLDSEAFRIQVINNLALGKDEKVYLPRGTTFDVVNPADPNFTRVRDPTTLDIVIDIDPEPQQENRSTSSPATVSASEATEPIIREAASPESGVGPFARASDMKTAFSSLLNHLSSILQDDVPPPVTGAPTSQKAQLRLLIPAITTTGLGAAPIPDVEEAASPSLSGSKEQEPLSWSTIYFSDETCDERLPLNVAKSHQVIVMKRGGCSFSDKLRNIPAFPPSRSSLQLVIVVSYSEHDGPDSTDSSNFMGLSGWPLLAQRPLLDEAQMTWSGLPRHHPISMVMVDGGEETYDYLRRARGVGIRRRYEVRSQGVPISNLIII